MNTNEIIFKGHITTIEDSQLKKDLDIFYRIVNVNDTYFFAQEVYTGEIFPIFYLTSTKDNETFNSCSYSANSKNYVFGAIQGLGDTLKYSLNIEEQKKVTPIATPEEVNEYLQKYEKSPLLGPIITRLASQNIFFTDIESLKEKVAQAREDKSKEFMSSEQLAKREQLEEVTNIKNYKTPYDITSIESLGFDLATTDDLCNVLGCDNELNELIKAVAVKKKSVLIIGEPGAGKTSLVEKLALEMKKKQNKWLKDKMVFSVTSAAIEAGTEYRGTFEDSLMALINFAKEHKGQIILFFDEIHTLYGLGRTTDSANDAMNILKPYVSNGSIIIIGATTNDEYKRFLGKDPAFCRRFSAIPIKTPSPELVLDILKQHVYELMRKYNVSFPFNDSQTDVILKYIIEASDKKNQSQDGEPIDSSPTLAKDILENAFVNSVYEDKSEVGIYEIARAIKECGKIQEKVRLSRSFSLINEVENNLSLPRK